MTIPATQPDPSHFQRRSPLWNKRWSMWSHSPRIEPARYARGMPLAIAILCMACDTGPVSKAAPSTESQSFRLLGDLDVEGCDDDVRTFAHRVHRAGRYVAVSEGFEECVEQAMREGAEISRHGKTEDMGPYEPRPEDPFRTEDIDVQIARVLFVARSGNDVEIECNRNKSSWGSAGHGDWSHTNEEEFEVGRPWIDLPDSDVDGSQTQAAFFSSTRASAGYTFWHEVMHQHGYHDDDDDFNEYTGVPAIVGACMETVMLRSATCTDTCDSKQRSLQDFLDDDCECVDDPQYDVGVVLDDGESCPEVPGRYFAEQIEIRMDDEDTNNNNQRSGWIGRTSSSSNTRMRFCRVPGTGFRRPKRVDGRANYAVVRMGETCPPGSQRIYRYFDNEDDDNRNESVGQVLPSQVDRNTRLELCMFTETSSGTAFPYPDIGADYGVFASDEAHRVIESGWFRTDDEDDNNENELNCRGDGCSFSGASHFVGEHASATTMRLALVDAVDREDCRFSGCGGTTTCCDVGRGRFECEDLRFSERACGACGTQCPSGDTCWRGECIQEMDEWEKGQSFVAGDVVEYDGLRYRCLVNHTATAEQTPFFARTIWSLELESDLPWRGYAEYAIGDRVQYKDQEYQCRQAHRSNPGWEPDTALALWELIVGPNDVWHAGAAYDVNSYSWHNGVRYRCLQAHTSAPNWEPPAVPALWEPSP